MRGSVGSFGSPLPKSITGRPSASSLRRSSSSRTNGYVAISVSVGEIRTTPRYRSHNQEREPPSARPRAGRAAGAGIRSRGARAWSRREGGARRAAGARGDCGRGGRRRAGSAPAATRPAHLRGKGQARGAEGGIRLVGRGGARRRRRAGPGAAELAQLEYNLPRMRGLWQHLERLGGGVGTRGPGETQLETDRRIARRRVALLRRRLDTFRKQRETRRKARRRTEAPTIALAGYTNVGKSTLLNALTGADASVDDRLFETLDPTTRGFEHEGRRYLVTDTVGFIRRLPHQPVEGFAATLEETLVVDKIDVVDPLARRRLANRFPGALRVSALMGEGLDELRARLAARFGDRFEPVRLLLPHGAGAKLAELYALGAPIDEREDVPEGVYVRARLPRRELRRVAPYLVAEAHAAPARSRA